MYYINVDVLYPVVIVWGILTLLKARRRIRRKLHRFLWGTLMKRQDREKYQDMRIEDAIVDSVMEMVHDGSMNAEEEKKKLREYADKLGLQGLLPQKNVKKSICIRLKKRLGLKPVNIPGGIKSVIKDQTYDPLKPDPEGLSTSKYLKE